MRNRGFEVIEEYKDKGINLPVRKTKYSAGYDIEAAEDVIIPAFKPGVKPTLIPTGLKAYCHEDEFYMLVNRSSGPKKGLVMANSIGIIDNDYYNNESNEGHIFIKIQNEGKENVYLKAGTGFAQGIFMKYLVTKSDYNLGITRESDY